MNHQKTMRLRRGEAGLCLLCPRPPLPARDDRQTCALCALKLSLRGKAQRQLRGPVPIGCPPLPRTVEIRALLATGASVRDVVAQTGATARQVRDARRRWRPT